MGLREKLGKTKASRDPHSVYKVGDKPSDDTLRSDTVVPARPLALHDGAHSATARTTLSLSGKIARHKELKRKLLDAGPGQEGPALATPAELLKSSDHDRHRTHSSHFDRKFRPLLPRSASHAVLTGNASNDVPAERSSCQPAASAWPGRKNGAARAMGDAPHLANPGSTPGAPSQKMMDLGWREASSPSGPTGEGISCAGDGLDRASARAVVVLGQGAPPGLADDGAVHAAGEAGVAEEDVLWEMDAQYALRCTRLKQGQRGEGAKRRRGVGGAGSEVQGREEAGGKLPGGVVPMDPMAGQGGSAGGREPVGDSKRGSAGRGRGRGGDVWGEAPSDAPVGNLLREEGPGLVGDRGSKNLDGDGRGQQGVPSAARLSGGGPARAGTRGGHLQVDVLLGGVLGRGLGAELGSGAAGWQVQFKEEGSGCPSGEEGASGGVEAAGKVPVPCAERGLGGDELVLRVDEEGRPLPPDTPEGEVFLECSVPASINKYLRGYQREGIRFLFRQYARGTGGVLADDMGLGKTVQCVAFCAALLGKAGGEEDAFLPELTPLQRIPPPDGSADLASDDYAVDYSVGWPLLIVCPTSVIKNWERELNTWGKFRVGLCHGATKDSALQGVLAGEKEIIITSPGTFRALASEICGVPWHCVIWDEAHQLKSDSRQTYRAACRIPTRLRFGLTGTPMQNDYEELWCLLDWASPGCLGSKQDFRRKTEAVMKRGSRADATADEVAEGREAQAALGSSLREVLLRRTKALIAHQLPSKRDHIVFCQLAPLQLEAYRRVLASPDARLLLHHDQEPCFCGARLKQYNCCGWRVLPEQGGVLWPLYHMCKCDAPFDPLTNPEGCKRHRPEGCCGGQVVKGTRKGSRRICPFCLALPLCTLLRKISNHLELVKALPEDEHVDPHKFSGDREIAQMALGADTALTGAEVASSNFQQLSDPQHCGKLAALEGLLQLWKAQPGGNKVLLFSMSVRLLHIVESLVTYRGYDYLILEGSTTMQERQSLVDQFNSRPSIFLFLISTTAGGVGLNLTAANKVVILDPSWNPSHDLQAQDRAFRIGQKRDVDVYRFVASGTIEELVYSRQVYKQQQANMAVQGTEEPRMWAGMKGVEGQQGELWGVVNLLRLTAERVLAKEIIEARGYTGGGSLQPQFRVEECTAGASNALAGRGGDALLDEEEWEAEYEGRSPARAGGASIRGGRTSRGGGGKGCAGSSCEEVGGAAAPGGVGGEEGVLLAAGGVVMRHDRALAPLSHSAAAHCQGGAADVSCGDDGSGAQQAQQGNDSKHGVPEDPRVVDAPRQSGGLLGSNSAGTAGGGQGGGSGGGPGRHAPPRRPQRRSVRLSAVESLAQWQGTSPAAMARQLLQMSRMERQGLLSDYAQSN